MSDRDFFNQTIPVIAMSINLTLCVLWAGNKVMSYMYARDSMQYDNSTMPTSGFPYGYRTVRPQITPPKTFTGKIADWTTWKEDTMSSFGLLGLDRVIKSREYSRANPEQNATVYNMLNRALQGGNASSILRGQGVSNDGYGAWSILTLQYEGNVNKGVEAKRIRAEMKKLRLDSSTDGGMYLMICYEQVHNRFVTLNNFSDATAIRPRNMTIEKTEDLVGIDLDKYTKRDGTIFFPASIYRPLSKNVKTSLYKHNQKMREKRRADRNDDGISVKHRKISAEDDSILDKIRVLSNPGVNDNEMTTQQCPNIDELEYRLLFATIS